MGAVEAVKSSPSESRRARSAQFVRQRWRVRTGRAIATAILVQHQDHAPGDVLLDVLLERRLEPVVVKVDRGERLPDPTSLALAVVLGANRPWLRGSGAWDGAELDWLRRADAARVPVLALGTGAQLLATALGGRADRVARPRRGWVAVSTADPQLIPPGPWLTWDEAAIELPPRAELLAHDRVGPQAFRVDTHLGVQFHPGITPGLVREWVHRSDRVLDVQELMEATSRDITSASEAARRLFVAFADSRHQAGLSPSSSRHARAERSIS